MVNAFGERLFRILFKTYSKKVWDVDTKELTDVLLHKEFKRWIYIKLLNMQLNQSL